MIMLIIMVFNKLRFKVLFLVIRLIFCVGNIVKDRVVIFKKIVSGVVVVVVCLGFGVLYMNCLKLFIIFFRYCF